MPFDEIALLPKELRIKALVMGNREVGWRFEHVPLVVNACRELKLAILWGTVMLMAPQADTEFYWMRPELAPRANRESWERYVDRSCSEFLILFTDLVERTNFEEELAALFRLSINDYREKQRVEGFDYADYLCVEMYLMSEGRYSKRHK